MPKETTKSFQQRLLLGKHEQLAESYAGGIIATVITSITLALLLIQEADIFYLSVWVSAVLILGCIRFGHYYYYKIYPDKALNSKPWINFFYIGLGLSGLLWGSAIIFLPSKENLLFLSLTIMWASVIMASAVSSYSFTKKAYIIFALSVSTPMLIYLSAIPPLKDIYFYMSIGIAAMTAFLIVSSMRLNKVIHENLSSINNEIDKNTELEKQKSILNAVADASEALLGETWEQSIPTFLEKLGNNVSISRIQVFENNHDDIEEHLYTRCRFSWSAKDSPTYKFKDITVSYNQLHMQRWVQELSYGRSILGDVDSLPENEQHFLRSIDVESFFAIPIFVGNEWWGYISFDECKPGKKWAADEIDILKTTAAVIGAAIKRSWAEDKLSYHASHDSLTGLANRRAFEIYLDRLVKSCEATRASHALCYIDLDRFKVINDTCGHSAGDALLKQLGDLMKQNIREDDFIARLGGDEFAILLEEITLEKAKEIASFIQSTIEKYSFNWNDSVFRVGASIGIVSIDSSSKNTDKLLQTADSACRSVKISNTNQVQVFSVDDTLVNSNRDDANSCIAINNALENNQFKLYLQPICPSNDLSSDWVHFEVLIRMLNENDSIITPNWFLPTAERYNLITRIDRWVFEATIRILSENQSLYEKISTLSINISGASLCDPSFLNFVKSIFSRYTIPTEIICFEITETIAVSNLTEANNFITELHKHGCRFSLDDFGTGFSSFENLKHLKVDYVKIDGIFIRDICTNKIDLEMVRSLNSISKLMNIKTIAEYVEDDAILATLQQLGVDFIQGYAISKPLPLEQVLFTQSQPQSNLRVVN